MILDDLFVSQQRSGGVLHMYLPQETAETNTVVEYTFAGRFHPQLQELKRKRLFARFLHEALSSCRTQTEREVVLAAMFATKVRILQITKELNLPEEEGWRETSSSRNSVENTWESPYDSVLT